MCFKTRQASTRDYTVLKTEPSELLTLTISCTQKFAKIGFSVTYPKRSVTKLQQTAYVPKVLTGVAVIEIEWR